MAALILGQKLVLLDFAVPCKGLLAKGLPRAL